MKKQVAIVLGGGGARGALQVGALRALLEANIQPDLLVGTSAGAANATFLAIHGVNLESVNLLNDVWKEMATADLMPSNYLWLTVRALFNRPVNHTTNRIRDFFVSRGLKPELLFEDIQNIRLLLVSGDLNSGRPVIYGNDPKQSVLEGVLASTALPPWVTLIEKEGQLLMDGGVISNLPIEAALLNGATQIIALDLLDGRDASGEARGFGSFMGKLITTTERRQAELELKLAEARGVPVRYIRLLGESFIPLWDFRHSVELIMYGYETTCREIASWEPDKKSWWSLWFGRRQAVSNLEK